jgi:3,4-dihydroxy 2-butanone 4-phosphate synthase/GTP cyclohydrolase II
MSEKRLDYLNLFPMVRNNEESLQTAFTVSVDARNGVSTGISAFDRAKTIQTLIDPSAVPGDLVQPGHVFPLRARKGGVMVRAGHTEAAVYLARIAGLTPAGVICEIMSDDGSMARLPELLKFSKKHGLKICTIVQLIEYRRRNEQLVKRIIEVDLPTDYGNFKMIMYESSIDGRQHIALKYGEFSENEPILVRVHSECFTGDVLGSLRCDCGSQLNEALKLIVSTLLFAFASRIA